MSHAGSHKKFLNKKRRSTLIVLLLILLNVSMRLPTTPHIVFQDSYANLWKTGKIASLGYVVDDLAQPWRIDAAKLANLPAAVPEVTSSMKALKNTYPLPPPVLAPLTLAYSILLTGAEPEHAALAYSLILGLVGCVGAFLLAAELSRDRIVGYLTAFFYSTAPVLVSETSWTFLARALVLGLLPYLLLFFLQYRRTRRFTHLLISVLLGCFLVFAHRIGFVFLYAVASYALASATIAYAKKYRRHWKRISRILPYILITAVTSLILLPFYWKTGLLSQALWEYRWGYLMQGAQSKVVLFNMIADYYSSFGILAVFAVIGFVWLSFSLRKNEFRGLFMASYVLVLSPFAVFGEYTRLLALPAVAYLLSVGLRKSINVFSGVYFLEEAKFLLPAFIALSLVVAATFSLFMVNHWKETTKVPYLPDGQWMDDRLITLAAYVNAIPGKAAAPEYFSMWSTYLAPYLSEDEKISYVYDFTASNSPADVDVYFVWKNITHVLESRGMRKSWKPPALLSSEAAFTKPAHEMQDHLYANGLADVWAAYELPASSVTAELSGAFSGREMVVGMADGRLYILTSDGKVIVPLKRRFGSGITALASGDLTPRHTNDVVVGFSDGGVLLIDNAGREVWNYTLPSGLAYAISVANATGGAYADVLIDMSSRERLVLNSSGNLVYIQ